MPTVVVFSLVMMGDTNRVPLAAQKDKHVRKSETKKPRLVPGEVEGEGVQNAHVPTRIALYVKPHDVIRQDPLFRQAAGRLDEKHHFRFGLAMTRARRLQFIPPFRWCTSRLAKIFMQTELRRLCCPSNARLPANINNHSKWRLQWQSCRRRVSHEAPKPTRMASED